MGIFSIMDIFQLSSTIHSISELLGFFLFPDKIGVSFSARFKCPGAEEHAWNPAILFPLCHMPGRFTQGHVSLLFFWTCLFLSDLSKVFLHVYSLVNQSPVTSFPSVYCPRYRFIYLQPVLFQFIMITFYALNIWGHCHITRMQSILAGNMSDETVRKAGNKKAGDKPTVNPNYK